MTFPKSSCVFERKFFIDETQISQRSTVYVISNYTRDFNTFKKFIIHDIKFTGHKT